MRIGRGEVVVLRQNASQSRDRQTDRRHKVHGYIGRFDVFGWWKGVRVRVRARVCSWAGDDIMEMVLSVTRVRVRVMVRVRVRIPGVAGKAFQCLCHSSMAEAHR